MHLRALLDGAAIDRAALLSVPDDGDWEAVEITDVACDSRAARRGSLFCCIRGRRVDGHDHAPQAVAAGAVALVSEHRLRLGVPNVVVRSTADVAGRLAASLHGHPSRTVRLLGVTGTNGKTTTTYLLESILQASGGGVGVIGTVETRWNDQVAASALTTPDACELQALLARMRDDGVTDVAMEVSSHALHQGRVLGCEFSAACFTNLSQDHLDYHGTMEEYAAAKRSLFTPRYTQLAVTNVGDAVGRSIATDAGALGLEVWTYAQQLHPRSPEARAPGGLNATADVTAVSATFTLRSIECTITGPRVPVPFHVEVPLVGPFNLENMLAAATTALAVGVPAPVVASALRSARPVPGRLELVPNERGLHVFVDYAHTPEALTRVLAALRAVAPSSARLVVVYGAGGDRDRHKRPLMAMAVADGADVAVLTSDNPRSEDPAAIAAEVLRGVPGDRAPLVELDRRAAIALALREASAGDVVVIAGKGHEQGQTIDDVVIPFDDVTVVRELLGGRVIALFLAVAASFVASVVATPVLIKSLRARKIGQQIRDDGPVEHPHVKKVGTPTMGGFAIVGAAVVGYAVAHLRRHDFKFSRSGILLMALIVACMCVGALDDYLGIRNQRNLGLRKRGKVIGLIVIASLFAAGAVNWAHVSTKLSFTHELGIDLGAWGWGVLAVVIILATTNAANITDGLDGLLSGTGVLVFGVYAIIAFWEFRHFGTYFPSNGHAPLLYPYTVQPAQALDLMTVAGAMLGGCTGFLWWNAAPARIFMGDTGSMAIGGAMAGLALFTHTILLLPIIAGLCLVETLSVIAQVISFRGFGRRVLRMSPIHHHFELLGWPETTVTVRFWIFAGLCAAFGLGLFYADFLRLPGVLN